MYLLTYIKINFVFRYMCGVTKHLGLNESNKFDNTQAYVTKCYQQGK